MNGDMNEVREPGVKKPRKPDSVNIGEIAKLLTEEVMPELKHNNDSRRGTIKEVDIMMGNLTPKFIPYNPNDANAGVLLNNKLHDLAMINVRRKKLIDELKDSVYDVNDLHQPVLDYIMNDIPDYFWSVPASSTGKHHPQFAQGDGGLFRHTIAAMRVLKQLLVPMHIYVKERSNVYDIVNMFEALAIHDTMKLGTQKDYEEIPNLHTREDHPELVKLKYDKNSNVATECERVEQFVREHMGRWGKYKPVGLSSTMVHTADYLASRKDLEMLNLE